MLATLSILTFLANLDEAVRPHAALAHAPGGPRVRRAIALAAARSETPWWLLAGLCWRETRCRPGVRSRRTGRSWGLFQLRVSASTRARYLGRERLLLDPLRNAVEAARSLRTWRRFHLRRCRGDRHPWWSHWQWGAKVRDARSGRRVLEAASKFLLRALTARRRVFG